VTSGRFLRHRICSVHGISLDPAIINIPLPAIAEYFSRDIGMISRVVMVYLLTLVGKSCSVSPARQFWQLSGSIHFRRA
jgi:hypothetical protein